MIGTRYPNDDTSWVIVFPSSMVCGTNLLNLPTYSSLSHVFPLNLTLTQNSAARFQKNAKFCSVIRRLTIIKPRPGLSSCHPGGVRLQRWAFWGGWTLGKNVRNLIFPCLLSHSCTMPKTTVRMIFYWECGDDEDPRGRLGSDKFCVIQVSIKEGLNGHWHWCLPRRRWQRRQTSILAHSVV